MEKNLSIKLAGQSNGPIYDILVSPGTTPRQIMRELRLPGYQLFNPMTTERFAEDADIFPVIENGSKALAVTEMVAGRNMN